MIPDTDTKSVFPEARTCGAVIAIIAITITVLWTGMGAATAQTDQPTVNVNSATTTVDDTTTVDVILTGAPNGLSGYYLDVTVEDTDVARITAASYPDRFGLTTDPALDADGRTVTLEAADMEGTVAPGATNVTLATVEVASSAAGEIELTVEPRQFDTDDGDRLRPDTQGGVLTVDDGTEVGDGTESDSGNNNGEDGSAADSSTDETDAGSDTREINAFGGNSTLLVALVFVIVGSLAGVAIGRRSS